MSFLLIIKGYGKILKHNNLYYDKILIKLLSHFQVIDVSKLLLQDIFNQVNDAIKRMHEAKVIVS